MKRLVLSAFIIFLWIHGAGAAITQDGFTTAEGNTGSLTFSFTNSGGSMLVVLVSNKTGTTNNITGITFNSVGLTRQSYTIIGGNLSGEVWSLFNPFNGLANVVITSTNPGPQAAVAVSYIGCTNNIKGFATASVNSNAVTLTYTPTGQGGTIVGMAAIRSYTTITNGATPVTIATATHDEGGTNSDVALRAWKHDFTSGVAVYSFTFGDSSFITEALIELEPSGSAWSRGGWW